MKLYDTLSGRTEDFSTPDGKVVRMYVCGVTPYAPAHIGHAMSSVVFDVVRRYLEFKGYEVKHIQNFTDIDDKMIEAAAASGTTTQELADRNIDAYLRETRALNVLPANAYPRASQEIPQIVEMIKALVENGSAYTINGDVYFRVREHEGYGKLSHRSLDNIVAGTRIAIDKSKEDVSDFALWKSQKPGEPAWDSPWGPGRPGWHIECSAMAMEYLGRDVDIHGGGEDLVFPHHENELAQTEAYTNGAKFVRFWMHNGMLRLGDDKMSKSMGNFITSRDALRRFSPDGLRLFFLGSHYRSPLSYSDKHISVQERAAARLRNALRPSTLQDNGTPLDPAPYAQRFVAAMDNDLNTPEALAALFDLARDINRGRTKGIGIANAQEALREFAGILGLTLEDTVECNETEASPFVQVLVDIRAELRSVSRYDLADKIRLQLAELGVTLEDTDKGTEWKITVVRDDE